MFHDDSVAGSWRLLVERLDATDALVRWAADDDRLAGLRHVTRDLLPLLAEGADASRADDILGALVRNSALDGGADDDALLLMVHLLSDWVIPLATQLRDLGPGMVGVIVSELTCQIRTTPPGGRTRAVAFGLKCDTRCAVLGEFRPSTPQHRHRAERVLEPRSPDWQATPLGQVADTYTEQDIDLVDLLRWAARCGVYRDDIALLLRTEQARDDATLKASDDLVAAEFGLSRRTFFRIIRDECWKQMRLGTDAVKSLDGDLRLSRRDGCIQAVIAGTGASGFRGWATGPLPRPASTLPDLGRARDDRTHRPHACGRRVPCHRARPN